MRSLLDEHRFSFLARSLFFAASALFSLLLGHMKVDQRWCVTKVLLRAFGVVVLSTSRYFYLAFSFCFAQWVAPPMDEDMSPLPFYCVCRLEADGDCRGR